MAFNPQFRLLNGLLSNRPLEYGVFYLSRKAGTIRSGNFSTGMAMNNYVYRVTEKKDFGSPGEPGENFEAVQLERGEAHLNAETEG